MALFAQGTVNGTVTDAATGQPLAGANVIVEGTTMGAAADAEGAFTIVNVPEGTYTITASVIGYASVSKTVNVTGTVTVNFALETSALQLSGLEVLASRATRETPVAFTNVEKEDMELRLGSRDIPLVLNTTPSVYATAQGGGAGDARVNVRGFNQRNVAIMINGVPVNDMENAWVYWSNWDGVGDATSSIQVQRGLSAVNLATPSIGGTMNIITDPASHRRGGLFKQELGSWGFLKTTLSYHTGLIGDRLALSGTVVKKSGDGYYGGTWTDAWAYYFGASLALSDKDRIEFYALGAPQRHGQNLYKQNIATYSKKFAESVVDESMKNEDSDGDGTSDWDEYFSKFVEQGRDFNQNWGKVSNYSGKQYWAMYTEHASADRYDKSLINERENFFHKPQVNLNWYHTFNDRMRLSSIVYWSGGHGGGTGTYGKVYRRDANGELGDDDYKFYYGPSPWSWDWNKTIEVNQAPADTYYVDKKPVVKGDGESIGILRNSRNNQWTIGVISKLFFDLSDALRIQVGIDWRTAEIDHFREVRDLLGGEYWVKTADEFNPGEHVGLGDKIVYYFTNTVDWLGFFGQGEFKKGPLTAYGMFGYSTIAYTHTNHFINAGADDIEGNENDKGELYVESGTIPGYQVKGGASYNLSANFGVFGNLGIVSKVPIFDNVIDDRSGAKIEDPVNEKFTSFEAGAYLYSKLFTLKANYYNTTWTDRAYTIGVYKEDGSEGLINLTGVNANHSGIELEAALQPMSLFRLDAAISLGDWHYIDDASGTYKPVFGLDSSVTYNFYIKDLKVGDAPQKQVALSASVFPIPGFQAQLVFKRYMDNYADWDPFSRTDEHYPDDPDTPGDRGVQSWKAPDYSVVDLHLTYNLPVQLAGAKLQLFAHVFNLLDEEYIQDAVDNSRYNAFDKDHDADDAEVFFGIPRQLNFGLAARF
jgi:hypothetical protein